MEDIEQLVKNLVDKIEDYQKDFESIHSEVKELKNKSSIDQETISSKEKELGEIKTKLFTFVTERDNCKEQIGKKIEELNSSNLSKEDKAEQITKLMTGEYKQLQCACDKLTQTFKNLGKAKDSLNELSKFLIKTQEQSIKNLEKSKQNQMIAVWVLLGLVVLLVLLSLSLSLSILLQAKKKKKTITSGIPKKTRG